MENKVICGARTRKGTPCKKQPINNTKRCGRHGGKSTGPKNRELKSQQMKCNKNAVKTGEYETISYEMLLEEEKQFLGDLPEDPAKRMESRMVESIIRNRRLMGRLLLEIRKEKPDEDLILKLNEALDKNTIRYMDIERFIKEVSAGENNTDGSLDKLAEIIQQHRANKNG